MKIKHFLLFASTAITSQAASVGLVQQGTTDVFDVFTSGLNIGTVTVTGNFVAGSAGVTGSGDSTLGSDSIAFGSRTGISTFTFALSPGYFVDVAEFGTANGIGVIGEIQARDRPVGYSASFDGTVFDGSSTVLDGQLALGLGGTSLDTLPATGATYAAGDIIVNNNRADPVAADEYLIVSNAGLGNGPIDFEYHLFSGGGDTDAARFSFTVVPEPSSSALLGLGVVGFLARRRR